MSVKTLSSCGIGLRFQHVDQILAEKPPIAWLEALTDNHLQTNGVQQEYLCEIAEYYPVTLHGVGLSLGSLEALDVDYLQKLRYLIQQVNPVYVSDHLCWTHAHGFYSHDLLPMPYNESTLLHSVQRIQRVQDYLGRQLVVENVSSYLQYQASDLTEWEFINAIADESGCGILLDVNNIHVNAFNHGFDAAVYLNAINPQHVKQVHLAGHEHRGTHILDTHGSAINGDVWCLYAKAIQRFGALPTLIEWDQNIPPLATLLAEAAKADEVQAHVLH